MLQVTDKGVDVIEGEKVVRMRDTEVSLTCWKVTSTTSTDLQVESVQLMFPQDRNLHGKVFGGFLMRLVSLEFLSLALHIYYS